MTRISLIGAEIDNVSMDEVLTRIVEFVEARRFSYAVTPNVDHIMQLRTDPELRAVYAQADLVLADGVPLVWASRMLGTPLKERVNGTDLFERMCEVAARRGYSIFLLGGSPGAALSAANCLKGRYPELKIAGCSCPSLGFHADPAQNRAIQTQIRESGADILFVGLGAPKQEKWIYKYAGESGVAFAVGIGISFSFVAGEIRRAPLWIQRHGLEWFWRLMAEPRRLWKRYLLDDVPFISLVLWKFLQPTATHKDVPQDIA
jgi:N-acetylglucosaminyldiphosphoundecaprenol N-acetyl-beta-D-mannosaminyltransferase